MGGDGALTNSLRALKKENINIEKIQFVILPFGSGNDAAKVFGWGSTAENFT